MEYIVETAYCCECKKEGKILEMYDHCFDKNHSLNIEIGNLEFKYLLRSGQLDYYCFNEDQYLYRFWKPNRVVKTLFKPVKAISSKINEMFIRRFN